MFVKKLLAMFICFCFAQEAFAYHIIGGEMYYTRTTGNNFEITLKIYRDCSSPDAAAYDDPLQIYIYNAAGTLVNTLNINFPGSDLLDASINSPCITMFTDLCVQEAIYTATVNLPPSIGGYDLVYQRCCRNTTIINIIDPMNTGATYTTHIPNPDEIVNSSPRFSNLPPIALCVGFPFEFDHVATDPDGDELVYEFFTTFSGASAIDPDPDPAPAPPFAEINYLPPFNEDYPIASSPAFTINPATGWLEGTPTSLGQFVVGIAVKEYRAGVLIGTHFRDFQFNITDCEPSVAAIAPNVIRNCENFTVEFENGSFGTDEFYWDFGVDGITTDTSTEELPVYTFPDTGTYTVMLIAFPNQDCSDTIYIDVLVYPTLDAAIGFENTCVFDDVAFLDLSTSDYGTITDWQWNYGDGWGSAEQNPAYAYDEPGNYLLIFTVTNSYGCVAEIYDTIQIYSLPFAFFDATNACVNSIGTVFSTSVILAGNEIVAYEWITPEGDIFTTETFDYFFDTAGAYVFTLNVTSDKGCTNTITDTIFVPEPVNASPLVDASICEGDSLQLFAGGGETYEWFPATNISDPFIADPIIYPTESTTYVVIVSNACSSDTVFVNINVLPAPDVVAGPDTIVYSGNPVQLLASGAFTYVWSPDNGLTDSYIPNPIALPNETTQYILTGTDESGCTATDTALVYIIPNCFHFVTINAFSPNGDGINDKFRFITDGDDELVGMDIYNRWGDLVFQTNNIENGWDGTDGNGKEQEIGSYIFRITTTCDGILQSLSGSVTLLR
jgi:gliding motility-associated-like protein